LRLTTARSPGCVFLYFYQQVAHDFLVQLEAGFKFPGVFSRKLKPHQEVVAFLVLADLVGQLFFAPRVNLTYLALAVTDECLDLVDDSGGIFVGYVRLDDGNQFIIAHVHTLESQKFGHYNTAP
jgi:hypothetical protein